ncbi:hypothetical protein [Burkholderia sp. S171]|jgi:hypothetical protein|uniref:hypothetical protein n=1 Tax=Burkholderia sp. S171 TaxID=1641860 RepID=UPI00131B6EBD|nr:hypothetical protein [Burkholderia sp. S171]
MSTLHTIVPDVEVLLKLEPEGLAPILLRLGKQNRQGSMFMLGTASLRSAQTRCFGRLRVA